MKRVLLIKLTSLGDLIHALPAITDARRACPDIEFDWVIDEQFQEIAEWHLAVKKIFTTNHRNWRNRLGSHKTYHSLYELSKALRSTTYDLIIDGQGNFKSALLTMLAKGVKAGFDKHSVREKVARFAYDKTYSVSKQLHAIERLRRLFSLALNYPLPATPPEFQIVKEKLVQPMIELPSSYVVFVHNAGWKTKLWPEPYWVDLIKKTTQAGYTILLPWGNLEEELRAQRLNISPLVKVLPKLSLSEMGYVLAQAKACVCMDTGLSHLTAALNVPSLTLYGSTDSGLIGASGHNQLHFQSTLACAPCNKKTCAYTQAGSSLNPPCLAQITPERIFQKLLAMLQSRA